MKIYRCSGVVMRPRKGDGKLTPRKVSGIVTVDDKENQFYATVRFRREYSDVQDIKVTRI